MRDVCVQGVQGSVTGPCPFLVRSGDRIVLILVLYPLQGCTICRLVSLARPRRLAEPDKAQKGDVTVKGTWWVHRVLIRMSFPGLSHVKEHQKLI